MRGKRRDLELKSYFCPILFAVEGARICFQPMQKEINFDRFIRGLIAIAILVGGYFLIDALSGVLIPFFIAWAIGYMLQPLVVFFQHTCRLRNKALSVTIVVLLFLSLLVAIGWYYIPALATEAMHLKDVALRYIQHGAENTTIPDPVQEFIRKYASELQVDNILQQPNVQESIKRMLPRAWEIISSTAGTLISFIGSLIAIIYLFLILLDWECYAKGWINYVPHRRRPFMRKFVADVETYMAGYFRGQALVALSNCVMFSIGFALIGFPMPVFLGVLIGIISFVPYLQVVGFLPATLLALLEAADKGENFWLLIGGVVLVYVVVQIIQDIVVTPKIMGHIMGLRPAIIFLSLSVFGYLLGIIGLIIALPFTTLALIYYKEFVIGEDLSSESLAPLSSLPQEEDREEA